MNVDISVEDRIAANMAGVWVVPENLDTADFDFNWRPSPTEKPYIHQFGTQWQKTGGPRFVVPGNLGVKYQVFQRAKILPNPGAFRVLVDADVEFDWSWHPDDTEPGYTYVFGNQYLGPEEYPTVEYIGGPAKKYINGICAKLVSNPEHWVLHRSIHEEDFDLTWYPPPWEPPYIYVWGNQWHRAEDCPTVEYHMPGATDRKYMNDKIARLKSNPDWWQINDKWINPYSFDFNWAPPPYDPPYIYAWGNTWVPAEVQPCITYTVPGATQYKYMPVPVELDPVPDVWIVHDPTVVFDNTWRPNPHEQAYIYVWGNKWVPGEVAPTLEYRVPGATTVKYMPDPVEVLPETDRWVKFSPINESTFDFTWRPHPGEPPYIYVWGNRWVPGEVAPTLEYRVPGATTVKYMPDPVEVLPETDRWVKFSPINESTFDFSWRPNPSEPPYIYVWGNRWVPGEVAPTLEYRVPGAKERKYMLNPVEVLPETDRWVKILAVDESSFDFTWRPDPGEPPYIYVWGNQHHPAEIEATVEYHAPGATERKYMADRTAVVVPNYTAFNILIPGAIFDYTWRPDPGSPPYIYVWGNQWNNVNVEPTLEYRVPGATDYKYIEDTVALVPPNKKNWAILVDGAEFDWSWRPDPREPAYIYVWGNKWNPASTEPTVEYHTPGATQRKYMDDLFAQVPVDHERWTKPGQPANFRNFDYTWRPNPGSPPQIYQWEGGGPTYSVPGATQVVLMQATEGMLAEIPKYYILTTLEDLIQEHSGEVFWALNPHLNYEKFDFSWKPDAANFRHINVFGNEFSKDTQTYYINGPTWNLGYREINYVEDREVVVDSNLDMFWVDTGLGNSLGRFTDLKIRYPQLQKTRYTNSWVDTIARCAKKSSTTLFWVLCSDFDYSDFSFTFYPDKWQIGMLHVFGTQWNHWGNTYLVNGATFTADTKYIKVVEHLKNINHVRGTRARTVECRHDILYIDHENPGSVVNLEAFKKLGRKVYIVKYNGSYLKTLRGFIGLNSSLAENSKNTVWVTSSICDYADFDFSWQPDPFQTEQVHVFPSQWAGVRQKFGDTFLINLHHFAAQINYFDALENYPGKINFVGGANVKRSQHPVITHGFDSQAEALNKAPIPYSWPYYEFRTVELDIPAPAAPPLWGIEQAIITASTGSNQIYVPAVALGNVDEEVYGYPHLDRTPKQGSSKPLDIIFISNGEPAADENWSILIDSLKRRGARNRVLRVQDVDGRIRSQHTAANMAATSWYFLVNGKIKVNDTFDWGWQPDRLQKAKHYIFNAENPVNGLIYGHQAVVANNRALTLGTMEIKGLDFTLSSPHEVVDMVCGVAIYNTDQWTTWRTAFRESIKLRNNSDSVSKFRLERWLDTGAGNYAEWSQRGAADGVEYWNSVSGDLEKLLLSYDWNWIKGYYIHKYRN